MEKEHDAHWAKGLIGPEAASDKIYSKPPLGESRGEWSFCSLQPPQFLLRSMIGIPSKSAYLNKKEKDYIGNFEIKMLNNFNIK